MDDSPATGNTDQTSPVIIERTDGASPMFLSIKLGRDFGQPGGAWTPSRDQATRMNGFDAAAILSAMSEADAAVSKAVAA